MRIGIIGTGRIGGILAELWLKSGHEVMVGSKQSEKLDAVLKKAVPDCRKGSIEEAAQYGEVVVLSIPPEQIDNVIQKTVNYLDGKVIIDTMNSFIEGEGISVSEVMQRDIPSGVAIQERFPKAKVVRAFSSISYIDLKPMSYREPEYVSVPFCCDERSADEIITQLISDAGFKPYYLGPLLYSKPMDPGGKIYGKALTEMQIRDLLNYK